MDYGVPFFDCKVHGKVVPYPRDHNACPYCFELNALRAQLAQAEKALEEARAALRKFTHRPPYWGINSALDAETTARREDWAWTPFDISCPVPKEHYEAVRAAHGAGRGREGA